MLAHRMLVLLGALGIAAASLTSVRAGNEPGRANSEITRAECERLVARLVNPDKAPFTVSHVLRPPRGTTEETLKQKQAKVLAAYDELWDNFEVALPVLAKHAGVEKWWKARQSKTLAELQLEGIQWALRQPKPKFFRSKKEWARAKKSMRKMARGIRASKKPISTGNGAAWHEASWAAVGFERHHPVLIFYK